MQRKNKITAPDPELSSNTAANHFFSLSERDCKILSVSLVLLLCIGAVVPLQEIARSIWNSFPEYPPTHYAMITVGQALENSNIQEISSLGDSIVVQSADGQLWYDNKKTLQKVDEVTTNYIASIEDSIFYKYLARQD